MSDNQASIPAPADQAPGRDDYRRAAALMVHVYAGDVLGFNDTMAEADQLGRMSSLVIAVVEIAGKADVPLASPEGIAGLRAVAAGMALDEQGDTK